MPGGARGRATVARMAPAPLAGSSILLTGASGGLGSRCARLLVAAGAHLTLVGRDAGRLAAAAELAAAPGGDPAGGRVELVVADLRDPAAPAAAVARALAVHGHLDGVLNTAGVVAFGPVATLTDEVLDELVAVSLLAPVRLARAALPALTESAAAGRAAFLATVSAVVAEVPTAGMAAYSAVKAAVTAFDAALARELRSARVRVLDIRPPHTETGLAGRPIAGQAPRMATGRDPDAVAARIVEALADGTRDLPAAAF